MYIFYRQNRKSVSDFINCFYEGETDDVIKQLQETDYRINEISKQLINNIDDYIYKNELKYPDAKDYLTVKRKVKRRKVLKQQFEKIAEEIPFYNSLLALKIELEEKVNKALESDYKKQVTEFPKLFSEEELLLFRNEHLKYKLMKQGNISLKKKDRISLYHYISQLSLKTGGVGFANSIGCFELGNSTHHMKPKQNYVVDIHNYLLNRLYFKVLKGNLSNFVGSFLVNFNYVIDRKKSFVLFKVLLDDPDSNIFRGKEREVKLELTSPIKWLLTKDKISIQGLNEYFGNDEIIQLLNYGILRYAHLRPRDDFSWIDNFDILEPSLLAKLRQIGNLLQDLNYQFSSVDFSRIVELITDLCQKYRVDTLGSPLLTIDTYKDSLDLSNQQVKFLKNFISKIRSLSEFYSIFDASKSVEELAYNFMIYHYPEGKSFKNFMDLDEFFKELAEFVFEKINLGALRSGFFEFADYPLIAFIINKICSSNSQDFLFSEDDLEEILKKLKLNSYNSDHSYAFFVQTGKEGVYLNHVYKGLGIFNNRYRDNFSANDFEQNYNFGRIFDTPYYFGFNANKRPERPSLDMFGLSEYPKESELDYRDIMITVDSSKRCLRFLDNIGKEFYFSFLGNMTPIVFPKTLAMFNSLSLTGGMYFDLSDLVLRKKYADNKDLNVFISPQIYFLDKEIIISRSKTLVRTTLLKKIFNDSQNNAQILLGIKKIYPNSSLFVREFFVDSDFKSKIKKPLFVNLNSSIGLENFIDYVGKVDWVTLETPQPEFSQDHLTEFIVESKNTIPDK